MSFDSAFIAYSRDASVKASQVNDHLTKLSVNTYMFERIPKKDPGNQIRNEIKSRDCLVMILSKKSIKSNWVSHEIGIATGANKAIFVVKTSHNLKLPEWLGDHTIISALESLDPYFSAV